MDKEREEYASGFAKDCVDMGIRKDMGDMVSQITDFTAANADLTEQLKTANEALVELKEKATVNGSAITKLQKATVVAI